MPRFFVNINLICYKGTEKISITLFRLNYYDIKNLPVYHKITSKQYGGYKWSDKLVGKEIYFKTHEEHFDKVEMGENLWDAIWKAGQKFNISPGCPNLIDRIEGGLMSYGNDFTKENNPLECNMENYCKENL